MQPGEIEYSVSLASKAKHNGIQDKLLLNCNNLGSPSLMWINETLPARTIYLNGSPSSLVTKPGLATLNSDSFEYWAGEAESKTISMQQLQVSSELLQIFIQDIANADRLYMRLKAANSPARTEFKVEKLQQHTADILQCLEDISG